LSVRSKKTAEIIPCSVPSYIVTFSDMITLLLTFFVMLLSLAHSQDLIRFKATQDSFSKRQREEGLGMLVGKQVTPELGQIKPKYAVLDSDENPSPRILDTREENIRRKYQKLAPLMKALPSQLTASRPNFAATPVRFLPGQAVLDKSAATFLTQFASDLQHSGDLKNVKLYVLGLADEEKTEKEQWIVSSLRAQRVAEQLKNAGLKCPVYAWGAGSGGQWVGRDGQASKQSQILIAVLRPDAP